MPPTDNELIRFASRFMTLTSEEADALNENVPLRFFEKGTILLRDGEVADKCYFILGGCVRQYVIVDGEERTTEFFTEEQAVVSFSGFIQGIAGNQYWECTEDTKAAVGTFAAQEKMFREFPKFEKFTRVFTEQDFGKTQDAKSLFMTSTPEERYLHLQKSRPDLIQRVPQHQLASYLGIKPESLSRIRKRIASRKNDH